MLSTSDDVIKMQALDQLEIKFITRCYLPIDEFINECYPLRWLLQYVLLPEMTSSMSAIYPRWLHQWVLSTLNFFQCVFLPRRLHPQLLSKSTSSMAVPKMTSSMGAIYLKLFQCVFLPRRLHPQVLSKFTSSMADSYLRRLLQCVLYTKDDFTDRCLTHLQWLYKLVLSTYDDIFNWCFLPKMMSSMGAIYQIWHYQSVLST